MFLGNGIHFGILTRGAKREVKGTGLSVGTVIEPHDEDRVAVEDP